MSDEDDEFSDDEGKGQPSQSEADLLNYYASLAGDEAVVGGGEVPLQTKEKTGKDATGVVQNGKEELDLDGQNFRPSFYVSDLLRQHSMKQLLKIDSDMIAAKATLDSDMQMLVYENYNKFISATDMIRTMKTNVESMEEEMKNLRQNIASISKSSTQIERRFAGSREQVENLVGVSRLLKRLEFLFELPGRLKKSIEFGAHGEAVKYWQVSNAILKQHQQIESFEKIRAESELIIRELKQTLRKIVRDPGVTAEAQLQNAGLLMDLDEPPAQLLRDIADSRRSRLRRDIGLAVQASQDAEQARVGRPSPEGKKGDEKELLRELRTGFVTPFCLFATTYRETFLPPQPPGRRADPQRLALRQLCEETLTALTQETFGDYFARSRKYLLAKAALPGNSGSGQGAGVEEVEILVQGVGLLCECVLAAHNAVPKAQLLDKCLEIVEHAVRQSVETLYQAAIRSMQDILREFHKQVVIFDKANIHTQGGASVEEMASPAPQAATTAANLRNVIKQSLLPLARLLNTDGYLPQAFPKLSLAELAYQQLGMLLRGADSLFLCRASRASDGPVLREADASSLPLDPAVTPKTPAFFLYLCQICMEFQREHVDACIQSLTAAVPAIVQTPGYKPFLSEASQTKANFQESAQALLCVYVRARGDHLSNLLLSQPSENNAAPTKVSGWVRLLWEELEVLGKELQLLLPPPEKRTTQRTLDRRPSGPGTAGASYNRKATPATMRDIERLFAEKVVIFGPVAFRQDAVLDGILKVCFKALLEATRLRVLSKHDLQQLQLDVYAVRDNLPLSLDDAAQKSLVVLLDEALTSGTERCLEYDALLSHATIEMILEKSQQTLS
eukprot:gb/GEZN01002107.1/.p1 GENE.gb/GEZN01002107.1/~~gb/GEZN01002107.1/.p1  ORF type:complete len:856 (+),score=133.20 gb/GEZN01002107.1/:28-2568(+)